MLTSEPVPAADARSRSHRMAGRFVERVAIVLPLVLFLLTTIGAMTMFQDHMLYYPARVAVGEIVSERLRAWPNAEDFRGLVAEPRGAARATAIVFHGNAGHAAHRLYYVAALGQLGLRVILAEYPGYGPREGPLGEASFVRDAEATIALAHAQYGAPLVLVGESLGAGVAAAAAAKHRDRIAALLLITPWDRLESVAAFHYPLLPVQWLLRDRYDSVAHLASIGRPVAVVVAEQDSIVPPRFGAALHEALDEPKRLVVVKGADHNDWAGRVDERWWEEAVGFLLEPPG